MPLDANGNEALAAGLQQLHDPVSMVWGLVFILFVIVYIIAMEELKP